MSAGDAVAAAIDRIGATNGEINAIVDDLGESATERAAELDCIQAASGPVGPLHGVPVTVKENEERPLLAQLMSVQGAICREIRDVRHAMCGCPSMTSP